MICFVWIGAKKVKSFKRIVLEVNLADRLWDITPKMDEDIEDALNKITRDELLMIEKQISLFKIVNMIGHLYKDDYSKRAEVYAKLSDMDSMLIGTRRQVAYELFNKSYKISTIGKEELLKIIEEVDIVEGDEDYIVYKKLEDGNTLEEVITKFEIESILKKVSTNYIKRMYFLKKADKETRETDDYRKIYNKVREGYLTHLNKIKKVCEIEYIEIPQLKNAKEDLYNWEDFTDKGMVELILKARRLKVIGKDSRFLKITNF